MRGQSRISVGVAAILLALYSSPLRVWADSESAQITAPTSEIPRESPSAGSSVPASTAILDPLTVQAVLGREARSVADENMGRIVDIIVDRSGQVMSRVLLNLAGRALPSGASMRLSVLPKPVSDRVLGLVGEKRCLEGGQLLVGPQPTESSGGLHHAGGGPAQRHGGVAPALYVATDATHRPHHILDGSGASERAAEFRRQPEPIDGEHLIEPFENALGDAGDLTLEPLREVAQEPLDLLGGPFMNCEAGRSISG